MITTKNEENLGSKYYYQVGRGVGKANSSIHFYLIAMGVVIVVGGVLLAHSLELTAEPLPFPSIRELMVEPSPLSPLVTINPDTAKKEIADKFGIAMIYPTAPNGREWFLNTEDPESDGIFTPQSILIWQSDAASGNIAYLNDTSGTWQIGGVPSPNQVENILGVPASVAYSPLGSIVVPAEKMEELQKEQRKIRMEVSTPAGSPAWKNVEITGYVQVISMLQSDEGAINWYARGGKHNDRVPCDGSALHGRLFVNGRADWQKEIWHTGGYTAPKADTIVTDASILGRWIGWKVVIYNINDDTAVKMESYIDNNKDNTWVKVTEMTDDGGWPARSSDDVYYSVDCGGLPKDYVVTNSGPIVTFRSDDLTWNFKNLSVREIQPPE